jgi:Flp pilus assembly protein TadG
MPSTTSRSDGSGRVERGSSVVEFVLVTVILVPLVLGVLDLCLGLYARNTVAAAASEGARYAAVLGRTPDDGAVRTRAELDGLLADRLARTITSHAAVLDGARAVEVDARVVVPALGLWGPGVAFTVSGHAIAESP